MTVDRTSSRPAALITGATAGIGFFTAAGLAARGWAVTVTGRNQRLGEQAVANLRQRAGHDDVTFLRVDHSIVEQNTSLATTIDRRPGSLDVLVNNVGGIYAQRWESADGYEGTLAMNFAGPVALTLGLLPTSRRSRGRCINIVSSAFSMATGDPFADLSLERGYVGINAYSRAKLLNVSWAVALAQREPDITVSAVNPGMAWTPSIQALSPAAVPAWRLIWPIVRWFQRRASAEKAATKPVRIASGEIDAASGSYINDKGKPERLKVTVCDASMLARVWDLGASLLSPADAPLGPDPN
jgi:NAD(P)-dependent dehydrogenase (short-subunit alcohol dehydrogenase family)